jgi:NitT/TauT family transport system permease protein
MRKGLRQRLTNAAPPIISIVVILAVIEFLVRFNYVANYLLPAPTEVFRIFKDFHKPLLTEMFSTTFDAFWGLGLSTFLGIGIAIVFSQNRFLKMALLPFAIFFQTVPIVAVAPLLVIWFGFGSPPVRASACIVSIFPILANTLLGLESTPAPLFELFQLYRASRLQMLTKLSIPFAVPYIISGIKIGAGLAIVGAIVGEFISGGGLGSLIDVGRAQQRPDLVFAAIILSTISGWIIVGSVSLLENRILIYLPFGIFGYKKDP